MSKYYYQMSQQEFYATYQLTDEDKNEIKNSIDKLGFSKELATGLRKQKVYEDSRYQDIEERKKIEKHLDTLAKFYKSTFDYTKVLY